LCFSRTGFRQIRNILTVILLLLSVTTAKADDRICLAEAMYHEARGQGTFGMLAVGIVIKNRVKHPNYPDTVCGVVRQGRHWKGIPLRHQCQFSYWCDGKPEVFLEKGEWKEPDRRAWDSAFRMAFTLLSTEVDIVGLENATHYHTYRVNPKWSKALKFRSRIGAHLFYE